MTNPTATATKAPTILLLGNPNTGKSTLFGALTGTRQKVANFPGVTVEARLGTCRHHDESLQVMDLPGTYSLAARSPDEQIASDALMGRIDPQPDAVVVVVDASNLDRNLYLATQILEHELPVVVALTMVDVARGRGIEIDISKLSESLGVTVIPVHAPNAEGIDELKDAIDTALRRSRSPLRLDYPAPYRDAVEQLRSELSNLAPSLGYQPAWPDALRLMVDPSPPLLQKVRGVAGPAFDEQLAQLRDRANGSVPLPMTEAQVRYGAIRTWIRDVKRGEATPTRTLTDRIDTVLTHKLWGTLIFTAMMALMFQAIYTWSGPAMDVIEGAFGALGELAGSRLPEGPLQGLVVDGLIGGVGGVLVFLPQIVVLFLFIAILEDLGYMSRAAFLMDRLLSKFGLSGRSFIPLLSSFACAIPGIMGARVIEDRNTRLTTIFLAPFMSCSARLPVYVLLIGALVPSQTVLGFLELQGLVLLAMYSLGILVAVPTAIILRKLVLRSASSPFLLELPSYKMPRLRSVGMVLWERAGSFVRRAGTIIVAVSVIVWALGYFPRDEATLASFEAQRQQARQSWEQERARIDAGSLGPHASSESALAAAQQEHEAALADIDNAEAGELLRRSALGRMGRTIEPLVRPLGWDWRIGMAAIASFPAREVVVASLGTIFNLGEADEESEPLKQILRDARRPDGSRLFSLATGLSIMVFFALCAQCAATLAVMRRETNSWKWPAAAFAYMTTLAYLGAFATYQVATMLGVGG